MLQRLPEQRDRSAMADNGEPHHAEAVPEHRGIKGQMQGLVRLLPALDRPEPQRPVERIDTDTFVAQPAPVAALPA